MPKKLKVLYCEQVGSQTRAYATGLLSRVTKWRVVTFDNGASRIVRDWGNDTLSSDARMRAIVYKSTGLDFEDIQSISQSNPYGVFYVWEITEREYLKKSEFLPNGKLPKDWSFLDKDTILVRLPSGSDIGSKIYEVRDSAPKVSIDYERRAEDYAR